MASRFWRAVVGSPRGDGGELMDAIPGQTLLELRVDAVNAREIVGRLPGTGRRHMRAFHDLCPETRGTTIAFGSSACLRLGHRCGFSSPGGFLGTRSLGGTLGLGEAFGLRDTGCFQGALCFDRLGLFLRLGDSGGFRRLTLHRSCASI